MCRLRQSTSFTSHDASNPVNSPRRRQLNRVADDKEKWMALLSFGKRYLQPPCRAEKRHNMTAIIRNRLNRNEDAPEPLVHALMRANIPSVLELSSLSRGDGKRPDGMTFIPWHGRKNFIWDVTVTDTIVDSYLHLSMACTGSVAKGAASRKETKYAALEHSYTFIPLAFEAYSPIDDKGTNFLQKLGRYLRTISDDPRESAFLLQRISITLQRFNAIAFSDTFTLTAETGFEA